MLSSPQTILRKQQIIKNKPKKLNFVDKHIYIHCIIKKTYNNEKLMVVAYKYSYWRIRQKLLTILFSLLLELRVKSCCQFVWKAF